MSTYMPGTRVKFTMHNLGLIGRSETVSRGDTGTVVGPATEEGWLYVEPTAYPQSLCPVTETMIALEDEG